MKRLNYIIILLGILLFSCKDPYADEVFVQMEDLPAASYMKAEAAATGEFSQWVDLLEYTNLFTSLNLEIVNPKNSQMIGYTLFVPSNQAISEYLLANNLSSVRNIEMSAAQLLVKYHTIPYSKRKQSEFTSGIIGDSTVSGDFLSIDMRTEGGGGANSFYLNDYAHLQKLDIVATNAIIHTIDKVLIPITETIWQRVNTDENKIFANALVACGLDKKLNIISETTVDDEGISITKRYKYTLFAVPNSIYQTEGVMDVASLAGFLNAADADYTNPENALYKYMSYHILAQAMSYNNLTDFGTDEAGDKRNSMNINTTCPNGLINFKGLKDQLWINEDTKITTRNINTKNGVMHIVDGLMPVTVPKAVAFRFEFTDYPELQALMPDIYRITDLRSSSYYTLRTGSVKCYKWKCVPEDKDPRYLLRYFQASLANSSGIGGSTNQEYSPMLNADVLVVSMGTFGWLEMQMPTIVQGKYKVTLCNYGTSSKTEGKLTFIIDGDIVGAVTTNFGGGPGKKEPVVSESYTFDKTESHTLRILFGDVVESRIDYLLFEPIL